MDAESIQRIVTQLIEEQSRKNADRDEELAKKTADLENQFIKRMEELQQKMAKQAPDSSSSASITQDFSKMPLIADIEPFEPSMNTDDDEDAGKFDEWLKRFQFSLDCAAPNIADKDKVKFLMTRLSKDAFSEYNKMCIPRDVTEFSFTETTQRLRELFDPPQYSLFADRYECLRIVKDDNESFRGYFQRVKSALRKFNFAELTEEQFSCLVALAGIRSPRDEAARTAILQRLNADGDKVRYEQVVGDCINLLKVREAADSSYQRSSNQNHRPRRRGRDQ